MSAPIPALKIQWNEKPNGGETFTSSYWDIDLRLKEVRENGQLKEKGQNTKSFPYTWNRSGWWRGRHLG